MIKKQIIEFESAIPEYSDIFEPSAKNIPDWYKKTSFWMEGKINDKTGKTIKQCMPFLDSFLNGYVCKLPCDIIISQTPDGPRIEWFMEKDVAGTRKEQGYDKHLIPEGFHKTHFVLFLPLAIRVPKGYSMLITNPLNRRDLPFYTLTGIVDGDFIMSANGQVPFFISNTFEGVVPQGTPFLQVLPFKQTNWKSVKKEGLVNKGAIMSKKTHLLISGWYKKSFWTKKDYI